MTVRETIEHLRRLQALDDGIRTLEAELLDLPQRLARAREDEAAVEAKLKAAEAELEAARKKRRDLERDAGQADQMVLKYETDKIKVKTNEEYKALNNQIAQEKAKKSEIETSILGLFDEEEAAGARLKKLKDEVAVLAQALAVREKDTRAREEEDRRRLEQLRSDRAALVGTLDERLLARYENIRARKGGVAVVSVHRGACGGCHTQQPPQKVNEIRKEDALHICDFCGRFLFRSLEETPAA